MISAIIIIVSILGAIIFLLTFLGVYTILNLWSRRKKMSEQKRTKNEYIERYANQYCNGDQEEAAGHAIVKEVCKTLNEE